MNYENIDWEDISIISVLPNLDKKINANDVIVPNGEPINNFVALAIFQ